MRVRLHGVHGPTRPTRPTRGGALPAAGLAALGLLAAGLSPVAGQAPADRPAATVLAGVGVSMGWFGAQGERYFADGRTSLFGGLGYTLGLPEDQPSGVAFAVGARRYTGGENHRAFLGLSVGLLETTAMSIGGQVIEQERHYGPALLAGYQYMADSGFTALASVGAGYAVGESITPAFDLGIGYTWR